MARRVVITGVGVLTPLGATAERLHTALVEGRTVLPLRVENGQDSWAGQCGLAVTPFSPEVYLGDRNLRPLDRTSLLLTCAARLALDDSNWSAERLQAEEVGLVVGTLFCSAHTIAAFDRRALQEGPAYVSPMAFANTVINAAAGQAAIWHNLRGINSTVASGATSGLQALAQAADLIRSGRAQTVLAGGVEELCFESHLGFAQAGLLADNPAALPVPFDAGRRGFLLGEGAALLMLEDAEAAAARGAQVHAEILGHGSTYDCSRGADAAQAVAAAVRAMRLALRDAGVHVAKADVVSASANGSIRSDAYEARALAETFAACDDLAVTAIKGMVGESLGAGGAVQTVALAESLRSGTLPGIVGLESCEERFLSEKVAPVSRSLDLRIGVVNSMGFDGDCCALVIQRAS
jgi:3-oxoacyl-[acyl-carrier-protein] synthase II